MVFTASRAKEIKSLQLAKFRKELGQFVVEGEKAVLETLSQSNIQVVDAYATTHYLSNKQLSQELLSQLTIISEKQMAIMTGLKTSSPMLAVAQLPNYLADYQLDTSLSLYLDNLQDPGNVGTILRLADWFGIEWVFTSPETADIWSPKVIQASMGAFLRIKTARIDLEQLVTPNTYVVAADMHGQRLSQFAGKNVHGILLLGNEGQGMSVKNEAFIKERVTIPRHAHGRAESLNVATAAAIILSHFVQI